MLESDLYRQSPVVAKQAIGVFEWILKQGNQTFPFICFGSSGIDINSMIPPSCMSSSVQISSALKNRMKEGAEKVAKTFSFDPEIQQRCQALFNLLKDCIIM